MKPDRLIGILSILLQREKVTAPELAEQFEVSHRTVHRDIETLCLSPQPRELAAASPSRRTIGWTVPCSPSRKCRPS
ncbi:helix-turn-helix transcriptional regulator [Anaerotruncus colihominis]|uniref:helix-turn-helix transcriptional regulator n=2 Tax=cellular organisms TaxID=131567 RepID=UPI003C6C255D